MSTLPNQNDRIVVPTEMEAATLRDVLFHGVEYVDRPRSGGGGPLTPFFDAIGVCIEHDPTTAKKALAELSHLSELLLSLFQGTSVADEYAKRFGAAWSAALDDCDKEPLRKAA